MFTLDTFYKSKEWQRFRDMVIADRLTEDGYTIDEVTGKPIVNKYDIILHHLIFLTEDNVNDYNISLNPELIQIVSHKTHNMIHNKLGYTKREIYLVYGCPLSGKSTYVNTVAEPGDLIVDINNIWSCISVNSIHSGKLNAVVFKLRDTLLESVKYRVGRWDNCYIVGGYPLISERERLCKELGAREIFIDTSKEVCLERASKSGYPEDYKKYIEDWWRKFKPGE
jgi:predicted kinase